MNLFVSIAELLKPAPPPDPVVLKALDHIAGQLDPLLKAVPQFEKHLYAPLKHALDYCEALVATLPGPIEISRQGFATDPMVHALFATADDIEQTLGRSQAVRDFLASPCAYESDHFHALLAARRQERKQMGMLRQGDVIRKDVAQTVVYFSDQTLIEPACQLEQTRVGLRCRGLESLLHTFWAHVEVLRRERDGLRSDAAAERLERDILLAGHQNELAQLHTRSLEELSRKLREHVASLTPEHLLDTLAEYLESPEEALRLTPVRLTLDRLGVVHNHGSVDARTIDFPELSSRDQRLHTVLIVRINRDEALAAVDRVRDQQHRFMLI